MLNKVILIGNLGKDPEIRYNENGRMKVTFPLATSETYKNKAGERVTQTEWHNIVLWTPLAELAEKYLRKGSQVYLEGRVTYRSYEDKEKVMKYITDINVREMKFISTRNDSDKDESVASTVVSDQDKKEIIEDLPF